MNYIALYNLKTQDFIDYINGCTLDLKNQILSDKKIQEKLAFTIDDIDQYRFFMFDLEHSIDYYNINLIEETRKKYYIEKLNSFDFRYKMFEKYKQINDVLNENYIPQIDLFELMDKDEFKSLTNKIQHDIQIIFYNQKLSIDEKKEKLNKLFQQLSFDEYFEIIIDYYFKDITFNFMKNLESLLNFNKKAEILSEENLKLYEKLFSIYNNKNMGVNILSNFDDNKNYSEIFYDDFSKAKLSSYNMINNYLFSFEKIQNQKNTNLSEKINVPVYDFNGEPFYALIHNTSVYKNGDYTADMIFNGSLFDATSMSLISNERLKTYNDFQPSVILGFNDIDIKNIVHLYNSDSFSSFLKQDNTLATKRVTKIFTPEELIKNTKGYNELLYQCKQDNMNENDLQNKLTPAYVVCFNDMSSLDIEVAKKYNIPIVNIDKTKYLNQYRRTIINADSFNDCYVETYQELKNRAK